MSAIVQTSRTQSYNVTAERREVVADCVAAWQPFQEIARELAEHRRRELGVGSSKEAER
jgi:hypothetical protein